MKPDAEVQWLALEAAAQHARDWIGGLDERSVGSSADLATLRARFQETLPAEGLSAESVVHELVELTDGGLLGSAGGRFFAWVIGGSLPSALAADWLTATWDQNAALFDCGPAVSLVEETVGNWLVELLDLPRNASFALTTGCQLAHLTGLAAARFKVLQTAGWSVEEDGLFGAPPIRVLVNQQKHGSVDRALRFLGLGSRSMRELDTGEDGRVRVASLEKELSQSAQPTIVVLNAADLNIGAVDPFDELIPLAKASGAWVHIDGAFGLFARASRTYRHQLQGVELADSWATDAHKWLNVPFDCGVAIVRDRDAHRAAMTQQASYVSAHSQARDQIDWNPEWSRRARGVPVYAALRELGRDGLEELIDRCCAHCSSLARGIASLDGASMLVEPTLNQALVRFHAAGAESPFADDDAYTDEVIRRINATGEAFFSGTSWRGVRAMRISVVNWRTSKTDVERAVGAVSSVLEAARRSGDGGGTR